jgi:ribosome-interacting GTPase 1
MKGRRQDWRAAGKPKKKAAAKDRAWFERKVAELKAELEKLPADRQEQLRRELEDEPEREQ